MSKQHLPSFQIYKIDYKNVNLLRRYVRVTGKILPRRITKLPAKEHRFMSKSIRQSRRVGIIPYVFITQERTLLRSFFFIISITFESNYKLKLGKYTNFNI